MNNIEIKYSLTMQTAFFIGSGLGIAGVVDKGCLKDVNGFVYIPGSSIKGKIRYFCKQLIQLKQFKTSIPVCQTLSNPEICKTNTPCLICKLFGSSFTEGALQFLDAKLKQELQEALKSGESARSLLDAKYQVSFRSNNKINRYSQITEKGHLFTSEVGESGLEFEGKIIGTIDGEIMDKVPMNFAFLVAGMNLVNNIGGQKSRGLGYIKNLEIEYIKVENKPYQFSDLTEEMETDIKLFLQGEVL